MSIIRETAKGYTVIEEEDILITSRKVFLTEEVDLKSTSKLIKQLMALDEENNEEITLFINSPGGEVRAGLAVYDLIMNMRSPVNTVCIGKAYSMGAILFLAGRKREVYEHSHIMIHDPSYLSNDIGGKKPHEIQSQVDKLIETRNVLARIISDVTGKSLEDVLKATSEDSYYNAEEALEFGLATGIIKNEEEESS